MKTNKKPVLEPLRQRQMEILKGDFPYDPETHTFTISLHHESVMDLLDDDISTPEHPIVSWSALERLSDIVEDLPAGENADIRYCIDDYKGYDPEKLVPSFNRLFSKNRFLNQKDKRKKGIASILFTLIGLVLLFFMVLGRTNEWFGEAGSMSDELLGEFIDIVAWVFLWEAVSMLALSPSEYHSINLRVLFTVSRISFYDGKGENKLSGEDLDEDLKLLGKAYNRQQRGKVAVLIASGAFLAASVVTAYRCVMAFIALSGNPQTEPWNYVVIALFGLASLGVSVFAGVSGILFYTDRPFGKKACLAVSCVLFLLFIVSLIHAIFTGDVGGIAHGAISIVVQVLYVGGYFCASVPDWFYKKRHRNEENQDEQK